MRLCELWILCHREKRNDPLSCPIPANELQRLVALRSYEILDTAPEIAYDEIVELTAQICRCPVAFISFIDDARRWIKAKYGLRPEVIEAPREAAACSTVICGTEVLVVPDMTKDPRFDHSPIVIGHPYCRFYCGMPLITDEGYALGTLCVMDIVPGRELSFETNRINAPIITPGADSTGVASEVDRA